MTYDLIGILMLPCYTNEKNQIGYFYLITIDFEYSGMINLIFHILTSSSGSKSSTSLTLDVVVDN